jgi:hypothetical protein
LEKNKKKSNLIHKLKNEKKNMIIGLGWLRLKLMDKRGDGGEKKVKIASFFPSRSSHQ